MNILEIQNLKKYFATQKAVDDISMNIEQGSIFCLLGPNGAGKTTIIGIMTGLVNKNSGSVEIFGHNIDTDFISAKKQIGVVPQEFNFNMFEKVEDIIIGQAGYYGIPREKAQSYCTELLERLELTDKKNTISRSLSGGMKRRLMIARALIHKPKLLILDEPTAGVDVELRRGMWDFLTELNKNGTTIILTTHYLEEVEKMCKNAAIIKKGKITQIDSVHNLLTQNTAETYVIEIDQKPKLEQYDWKFENNKLEIVINKEQNLNQVLREIIGQNIQINGIYPQSNRLEELFLN